MAANETAALVVALSAQVSKFQKDMDAATGIANKAVKQIEDRFAAAGGVITSKLGGSANNAASQLGTIGDALTKLGPIGLGVAAVFGSVILAFEFLSAKVDKFAEKMKQLQDASEATGLTITQLQALGQAGKRAGIDFEQTERAIERLSVGFQKLKTDGTGELFEQLLRIDPALKRQVASAGDLSEAVNILTKSFGSLNEQQKVLLAQAIGGQRGFANVIRLFGELGKAGGLDSLISQMKEAGKITDETMAPQIKKLRLEIEEITKRTDKMWGEAFSTDVLTVQKEMALGWEGINRSIVNASISLRDYIKQLFNIPANFADRIKIAAPANTGTSTDALQQGLERRAAQLREELGVADPLKLTIGNKKSGEEPIATQLATLRLTVTALGDAVNPSEQLKVKTLELKKAMEDGQISQEQYNRAMAAFSIAQSAAALAARESLGIAREQEISTQKLAELQDKRAKGFVKNAQEMATAEGIIARESKSAAEAQQVRASQTPELTRALNDARNGMKQFDQIATSAFNSSADAFSDVVTGTKTLKDAVHDLVNSMTRDLTRSAFKSLLASAFGGAGASGGIFSGLLSIGKNAGGTDNWRGGLSMVGESGPELVNIPRGSQVIPNDVLRRGGGGTPQIYITNHVDASGADIAAVSRLTAGLVQVNRSIEQRAVAAMASFQAQRG